jgi:hypothetical protein
MDDRRGIVKGILPLEEGVGHDRLPEITLLIGLPDSLIDGPADVAAEMDLLADLREDHRHPRILAHRQSLLGGDLAVPDDILHCRSPGLRDLSLQGPAEALHRLRRGLVIDLQ